MSDLPPELTEEQNGHGRTAEALRDLAGDISEGIEVGRAGDDNEIPIIWPAENIKDVLHRAADLIEELSLATINPQGPQAAALIERLEAERDEWTIERAVGQRQLDELSARVAELEEATTAFLAKFDECEPNLTSAFVFQQMHLGAYTGPNFSEELDALRKASKSLAQGEG